MFEECNKGHALKRAKPDTRHEAFETRRGWRGCRLAVTDGKKLFSGEVPYQGMDNNSLGDKGKQKKKRARW